MDILKNLSKRERLLLIVAVSCILLAIVYRLVMMPVLDNTKELDREIERLTAELAILQTVVAHRDVVEKEYRQLHRVLAPAGSETEQLSTMLSALERLASHAAVDLVDVKPRPTSQNDWSKVYATELKIEGDASQIMRFLARLNTEPGAYRVDNLQVVRKERSAERLSATLLASKLVLADPLATAR